MNNKFLSFLSILGFAFSIQAHATSYQVTLPEGIDGDSAPQRQTIDECLADVTGVIEWGEEGNHQAAVEVCDLRKEHSEAKATFVKTLQKMVDDYADYTNHEVNTRVADIAKLSVDMLDTCIKANDQTVYCHNIECVKYPERIRLECYNWTLTNPAAQHFINLQ